MSIFAHARLAQVAAAALLVVGAGAPVLAAPSDAAASTQSATAEHSASSDRAERRICANVPLSNTRISRRVCRTQAEWNRDGGVPGRD